MGRAEDEKESSVKLNATRPAVQQPIVSACSDLDMASPWNSNVGHSAYSP
jgi:hypothetical protein